MNNRQRICGTCALLLLLLLGPVSARSAEEYSFDLSEIEKSPVHFGGYGEFSPEISAADQDAALYRLKYYDHDQGDFADAYAFKLQLEGGYEQGIARLFSRVNINGGYASDEWADEASLYEGYLSLKPSSSLVLDAGKKTLRWGKGYAWNPVAFLDRPKNPDDPDLSLEGFVVASADYTRSFSGPLQTLSFTPVVIPVYDSVNEDFGRADHFNVAGKVYLLFYDTDIDFMALTGASRPGRYGADFSRNITSSFEVHGEAAWVDGYQKKVVDSLGQVSVTEYDTFSYLLGLRYLTENDITGIIEFYHDDTGYEVEEMEDYFSFIDHAYETYLATGSDMLLAKATAASESGVARANPMRDYLYARISGKEPFDLLYFTPAITAIVNLQDGSCSLSPEVVYTGMTNTELRLKASIIQGEEGSEYGEKPNDYLVELRVRYFF